MMSEFDRFVRLWLVASVATAATNVDTSPLGTFVAIWWWLTQSVVLGLVYTFLFWLIARRAPPYRLKTVVRHSAIMLVLCGALGFFQDYGRLSEDEYGAANYASFVQVNGMLVLAGIAGIFLLRKQTD